ncbi:MAG TPA: NGG1p interacting factor NIF3 [Methanomassiliicoccales archaeon]|nr:NGG1p interacting factor NIF3 [Methanomassiliicoccales archaeon]
MKLAEIYRLAVKLGMQADPRSQKELESELEAQKEKFEKLDAKAKQRFDLDLLWNPYHDTRLLFGGEGEEVKTALMGIDIGPGEVLIADRLREKGRKVDAVIGHHPLGKARGIFPEVMHVQENMYHDYGVPINVIEDLMAPRIKEVMRAVHPVNYDQAVDAARLLEVPLMCLHSPCDMLGQRFVQGIMDKRGPRKVCEIIDALMELPEYDLAARCNNHPEVYVGDRNRKAGKVMVKFAGGTAGPKEMYDALSKAGVGTVVCMHIPENHVEEAKRAHMNVVVSSHMASDSVGLNLFADKLESKGVKVAPFSGYLRVKRG